MPIPFLIPALLIPGIIIAKNTIDTKNYRKGRAKRLKTLKAKEDAYEAAALEKKLAREEAIELEKVKLARFAEEQEAVRDIEMAERESKNKNKKYIMIGGSLLVLAALYYATKTPTAKTKEE